MSKQRQPEKSCQQGHSKKSTSCNLSKGTMSKRSGSEFEMRITRRMKLAEEMEGANRCAICMNQYANDVAILDCKHKFCMDCLIQWWRNHKTCPFCREEIMFVRTGKNQLVYYSDLPAEKVNQNKPFITYCELCWGEIELSEKMNICTQCRSVYWHQRCLPFRRYSWYCQQCADENAQ